MVKKTKKFAFEKIKLNNLDLKNRMFYGPQFNPTSISNGKISEKEIKKFENLSQNLGFIISSGAVKKV